VNLKRLVVLQSSNSHGELTSGSYPALRNCTPGSSCKSLQSKHAHAHTHTDARTNTCARAWKQKLDEYRDLLMEWKALLTKRLYWSVAVWCVRLLCCSVCVEMCRSVMQCVAVCCSVVYALIVLQCVAVYYSVLQCVAVW